MGTTHDPRNTAAALNEWLRDAFRPPAPLDDEVYVVVDHPREISITVTWKGPQPGAATIRVLAEVRPDGTPELVADYSDELPPRAKRAALRLL